VAKKFRYDHNMTKPFHVVHARKGVATTSVANFGDEASAKVDAAERTEKAKKLGLDGVEYVVRAAADGIRGEKAVA